MLVAVATIHAQVGSIQGAKRVVSFAPGSGQTAGQSDANFPFNVVGLPDTSARVNVQVTSPTSVCSVGLGGEITLSWFTGELRNREGADFVVYENAFLYDSNKVFVEPAVVSVSQDGETWYTFPFDSITLRGCAGVTPTDGRYFFSDILNSGGDLFDIAELGLDYVRFVRLTDTSQFLIQRPNHFFYSPVLSGFDLDAIVGLNVVDNAQNHAVLFPSNSNGEAILPVRSHSTLTTLFDLVGKEVLRVTGNLSLSLSFLPKGLYIVVIADGSEVERGYVMVE